MKKILDFIMTTGRMPLLEIGEKPWTYQGWLRIIIQSLHDQPAFPFPNRWGYLVDYLQGTEKPIPWVDFDQPSKEAIKNLDLCVDMSGSGWGWTGFRLFLDWLSFAVGTSEEYPELSEEIQEKLYRTFNGDLWLLHPHDYLGYYICENRGGGWNPHAFFPTPHHLCELNCQLVMSGTEDMRDKTVCDPCVGTGRKLFAASNRSMLLYGADIDPMMIQIAKIQSVFYVPWLIFSPIGAVTLEVRDSLKNPPTAMFTIENQKMKYKIFYSWHGHSQCHVKITHGDDTKSIILTISKNTILAHGDLDRDEVELSLCKENNTWKGSHEKIELTTGHKTKKKAAEACIQAYVESWLSISEKPTIEYK